MKRKFSITLLIFVMLFIFTACGGRNTNSTDSKKSLHYISSSVTSSEPMSEISSQELSSQNQFNSLESVNSLTISSEDLSQESSYQSSNFSNSISTENSNGFDQTSNSEDVGISSVSSSSILTENTQTQSSNFTEQTSTVLSDSSISSSSSMSSLSSMSSSSLETVSSSSSTSSSVSVLTKHLLTVNYVGASSNPSSYTQEYLEGDSYEVITPTVIGYAGNQTVVSGVMGTQDLTVTVTYTAITYNISYDYNGGENGSYNPTVATYDSAFAPSVPTKSGYKFAGWQIAGVDTQTALYGDATSQTKQIYSELTHCYVINSSDLDDNGNGYWTAPVYFKNLTSTQGATITLTATWTCLDTISGANDSLGVINTANESLTDSKILEVANGLTGDFTLSFTYYQNALVDQSSLAFEDVCSKTGILGLAKSADWEYFTYIRQDGYSWHGSNPIGSVSTPSDYTSSNNYGEMFYGLASNASGATTTKFANFVRNSLVTYTIEGVKVGQVGGTLKITQSIVSFGSQYKNQSISIEYNVNLTDGVFYNVGIDVCVNAEDADISFESISYEITSDGYTYTSNDSQTYGTLVDNYSHYCPDKYWEGDFDFTVSYNQSQSNYYSSWGDTCWRTGYVVFYEWQNTAESVMFRNDWHGEVGSTATKITYDNNTQDIGNYQTATTGKWTSFGGSQIQELRLFRNASITARCVREGNTVWVYQFISTPGSSEVTLFNTYKFTTTISKLSFQIVGRTSGITVTYEDYSANTKVFKNSSFYGMTYGINTYSFTANEARAHMAIPFSVKAGTLITYKGSTNYCWSVLQLSNYLGAWDGVNHSSERLKDTGWLIPSTTTSYNVTEDCYIAVNIRFADNTTSFSGVDILALMQECFEITVYFNNNLNTNEKIFTTSMLEDNTTYGLTTYSGQFGESNTRCHMAVIPLIKKGTVITFTGGTAYNWSVLEMASERVVLYDTTWQDPSTVTSYTVSRDCYIAVNVKYVDGTTSFESVDIKSLLYNNIKIEGKCGVINNENAVTHSATEDGDMQSINHRGYSATAPENTLAAYSESKLNGFTKVECDINFTSDGYGVLLHDGSIDRTSDGSGNISDISFSTVRGCDFGSWKSSTYTNEQMPTVEEFLLQCKNLQLHPYLELKYGTKPQIQRLAMLVRRLGMEDNVTWISFDLNCLIYVRDVSPGARLGYLHSDITQDIINSANSLKTGKNEVFLDINYGCVDTSDEATSRVALCKANDLPLEVWTVNDETTMKNVYTATGGYVTGFTSDNTIAENVDFG